MQTKHLAIVRAALTFWDEELSAVSHGIYGHYLHSKDQEVVIAPRDVAIARAYFNQVVLKFGLFDLQAGTLVTKSLIEDSLDLKLEPGQQIVSILIH